MNQLAIEAIKNTLTSLYDSLAAYEDSFSIKTYSLSKYGSYLYLTPSEWIRCQDNSENIIIDQAIIYLEEISFLPDNSYPIFFVSGDCCVVHSPLFTDKLLKELGNLKLTDWLLRDLYCIMLGLLITKKEEQSYLVKFTRKIDSDMWEFDSDIRYYADDAIPLSDLKEEKDNNDGTVSISFLATHKEGQPLVMTFSELMRTLVAHDIYSEEAISRITPYNNLKSGWVSYIRLASVLSRQFFSF